MVIYYIGHVCLRPYVYSFSQIFHALRLYPSCPTSITDSRVKGIIHHSFYLQEDLLNFKTGKGVKNYSLIKI